MLVKLFPTEHFISIQKILVIASELNKCTMRSIIAYLYPFIVWFGLSGNKLYGPHFGTRRYQISSKAFSPIGRQMAPQPHARFPMRQIMSLGSRKRKIIFTSKIAKLRNRRVPPWPFWILKRCLYYVNFQMFYFGATFVCELRWVVSLARSTAGFTSKLMITVFSPAQFQQGFCVGLRVLVTFSSAIFFLIFFNQAVRLLSTGKNREATDLLLTLIKTK